MGPVGLLDSFVEDKTDYSYTYDNAIAAMAFLPLETAFGTTCSRWICQIRQAPGGGFLHRYRTSEPVSGTLAAGHNA
jgi:hypothetical protein